MDWNKSNILTEWFSFLGKYYFEFIKKSKYYHYKIIGIEINQKTHEPLLAVMISGIKNQIIKFTPKEIVINDAILSEFSPTDARAITFYALQQDNPNKLASITGQEFLHGKTVFILKKSKEDGEVRKFAYELYRDPELLALFDRNDLINIISTAIQEQTIEDLKQMEI